MNGVSQEELRAYFARVRPIYGELFSIAHAILGNYEAAEYAVQRAILDGWTHGHKLSGRLGFREGIRAALKQSAYADALVHAGDRREMTWNALAPDAVEGAGDSPLLTATAPESVEARRAIALHFGCGYRAKAIARLLDVPVGEVRATLMRFEARVRRGLRPGERRRSEAYCVAAVKAEFSRPDANQPDAGSVYRTLQVEADKAQRPRRRVSGILRALVAVVLMLALACLFWLAAVLLQQPGVEKDAGGIAGAQAADSFPGEAPGA